MNEIGGYLELERLVHNEYHTNMIKLNSANAALLLAIRERCIKKIYLPYYLCSSVFNSCINNNTDIEFYNIDYNLRPVFNKTLKDNEFLYIVNYYGLISNNEFAQYKKIYKNIIVDNVQAFFQRPLDDVITLYSCRKFFGVPDGAYIQLNCNIENIEKYEIVYDRVAHLIGRYEVSASEFYSKYTENEEKFSNVVIRKMSRFTENILGAVPYDEVLSIRKENFEIYKEQFDSINNLDLNCDIIAPYCYPLYVKNGADLRAKLIKNKVYIPTLWPGIDKSQAFEYDLSQNLIQLPCDQRYSAEDIISVVEVIKSV